MSDERKLTEEEREKIQRLLESGTLENVNLALSLLEETVSQKDIAKIFTTKLIIKLIFLEDIMVTVRAGSIIKKCSATWNTFADTLASPFVMTLRDYQIQSIDYSEVIAFSPSVLAELVREEYDINLAGLTSLSDEDADQLASHGGVLSLSGLTSLSDAAAESLSRHSGELHLSGLSVLSDAAAIYLDSHGNLLTNSKISRQIRKAVSTCYQQARNAEKTGKTALTKKQATKLRKLLRSKDADNVLLTVKLLDSSEATADDISDVFSTTVISLLVNTKDWVIWNAIAPVLNTCPQLILEFTKLIEKRRWTWDLQGNQESILFTFTRTRPEINIPQHALTNSIGMTFLLVKSGQFEMGESGCDWGENQSHQVRITRPFHLGIFQVTQEQYETVMADNPSLFHGPHRPVEHLTWIQATEYAERLSARKEEQLAGCSYRLPTEAEWECACRAGTTEDYWCGDQLLPNQANFSANGYQETAQQTISVGSFEPNPWGFYDMHGNVWEWCSDWFDSEYFEKSPTDDPRGPSQGTHHTLRGGAASNGDYECYSYMRGEASTCDGPVESHHAGGRFEALGDFGVRLVCEIDPNAG